MHVDTVSVKILVAEAGFDCHACPATVCMYFYIYVNMAGAYLCSSPGKPEEGGRPREHRKGQPLRVVVLRQVDEAGEVCQPL